MKFGKEVRLFHRTRELEVKIDQFLDCLSESGLVFRAAIEAYINEGCSEAFSEKHHHVDRLEGDADNLRRDIETQLYTQTLIPESRGDVLGLLENLDHIINLMESVLWSFDIERPD